jgi:hypothetical protein
MPEIVVKHNVKDATAPERETLPSGCYHALIIKVTPGMTNFEPKLQTIQIEYQIVKTAEGSVVNDETPEKYAGRGVWQDYILEPGSKQFTNQREAFRLQQLMAATKCPHKSLDGGQISFNTDHLLSKAVKITVTQRSGKKRPGDDPKEPLRIFNNVERIDSETVVDDKDLV